MIVINEAQKEKIVKKFKMVVRAELARTYDMHGYIDLAPGIAELITELALGLHKALNGDNIPITPEWAENQRRKRYNANRK